MSVAFHELRSELLIFRRSRESAFFIFVFPLLLLLLLGSLYDGDIEGEPAANYLLVGILGYGAANTAFGGLAIQLVIRREYGILKRIRSTPLPGWLYLACLLGSNLVVFALQSVGVVVLAVAAYDADWPRRPLALAAALLAGPEILVLDLGEVGFIDSTGLHVIVDAARRAQSHGIRFVVLESEAARRLFSICGVHELLTGTDAGG